MFHPCIAGNTVSMGGILTHERRCLKRGKTARERRSRKRIGQPSAGPQPAFSDNICQQLTAPNRTAFSGPLSM